LLEKIMLQRIWYALGQYSLFLISNLLFRLSITRLQDLPAGPKIYAPNHPSTIDPVVVMAHLPEPASILILETLFKVPFLGRSLRMAGHVPVQIGNGRAAFDEAVRLLQSGRSVMVFPEGAISPEEGGLGHAHSGVARLALLTGAPVIPIGIALQKENVRRVITQVEGKPEIGTWYFYGGYALTIGEPMHFYGSADNRDYVRRITERVMQRIERLAHYSSGKLRTEPAFWMVPPRLVLSAFRWLFRPA
jgi:1-acyl-sn-glycerol-3-phosphate acyltransferase